MAQWTTRDIPSQQGRRALVTGANSGIGFHAAKELARAGAVVLLACRSAEKGSQAKQRILNEIPSAQLEVLELDLASLASIRRAAAMLVDDRNPLHLLINNAGVLAPPARQLTADGFELQFGTNHLGHFALTGLLLPVLLLAHEARIVTVSSIAHRGGKIRLDDPNWDRGYEPWPAYRQSKLANLLFAFELDRRIREMHEGILSVAVHPGISNTNLFKAGPGQKPSLSSRLVSGLLLPLFGQSDAQGALPTLYGAVSPGVHGGGFYGPDGFKEMRGYPVEVRAEANAYDAMTSLELWQMSEEFTGVRFGGL
ncbi:oxidoreductase [Silvibacterium acidisoli]|uniref:oxidoreductase n=1 Tax=Acidobacteriaceae bacterium ZG23-2 TaxID=2883246 RepID=UPI00406C6DA6